LICERPGTGGGNRQPLIVFRRGDPSKAVDEVAPDVVGESYRAPEAR